MCGFPPVKLCAAHQVCFSTNPSYRSFFTFKNGCCHCKPIPEAYPKGEQGKENSNAKKKSRRATFDKCALLVLVKYTTTKSQTPRSLPRKICIIRQKRPSCCSSPNTNSRLRRSLSIFFKMPVTSGENLTNVVSPPMTLLEANHALLVTQPSSSVVAKLDVSKSAKPVFTSTSTRTPIQGRVAADPQHAVWLQEQTLLYQHQQRVDACRLPSSTPRRTTEEHSSLADQLSLSGANRAVAAKILVAEAASRDVARATRLHGDDPSHLQYRQMWWRNFAGQVDEFLRASSDTSHTDQVPRHQRAVENISSLGLWFDDESMALPMRQYTALTCVAAAPMSSPPTTLCQVGGDVSSTGCAGSAGIAVNVQECCQTVLTPIVIVGLCQFGYSNYVHDIRRQQQTAVLTALFAAS